MISLNEKTIVILYKVREVKLEYAIQEPMRHVAANLVDNAQIEKKIKLNSTR